MSRFELNLIQPELWQTALEILKLLSFHKAKGYLVGGCVRDWIRKQSIEELDIEAYGLEIEELIRILSSKFKLNYVGKSFGVIKLEQYSIDISVPRTEEKVLEGHKGFVVKTYKEITPEIACARRDFTMNAILYDPLEDRIIDPFNGAKDLENNLLKHTSNRFEEDPLRVLRAMQFIARFEVEIAPETLNLCQKISFENLSRERVFEEWKKLILKGKSISKGLKFLRDSHWVRYFPELKSLIGCEQYPLWHPEGDVFEHTCLCLNAFVEKRDKADRENLVIGLGVLCHDFGKPLTTEHHPDGKITSHGHDVEGTVPAQTFLERLTNEKKLIEEVLVLVRYHMLPSQFYKGQVSDAAIMRLSKKVGSLRRLVQVCRADQNGRGEPYHETYQAGEWLLQRAEALQVMEAPPEPILKGRHLIQIGLKPGRYFGDILKQSYQAQLDEKIHSVEEALEFIQKEGIITEKFPQNEP